MRLNFFFDVDGTLLPVGKGIPESAVLAIEKAKKAGHRAFLCTGRNIYEIPKELKAIPFDGGVYAAGSYVQVNGKDIYRQYVTQTQKDAFFRIAEKYDLCWLVQGSGNTYMTPKSFEIFSSVMMKHHSRVMEIPGKRFVDRFPEDEPFVKFYIMSDKGLMLEARHELDQYFDTVNDSNKLPLEIACEGVIPGLSKATGIRRAVDYLGESMDGTVGIGDGDNDMEMVQQCRMGIAMGNADEKLKQIADYVTADILDDGIAKAIEHAMEVLS